jgi:flavin reductase (DIM6/NTAB) family NADH-FMN oxidoreductase RutF
MSQMQAINSREFRDALGCYPTGVTVVTTADETGEPRGFTANSFTSVSLDPPLLLVCVAKSAHSHPVFSQAEVFSVNVLNDQQRDVSGLFASKAADKFQKAAWSPSDLKTPSIHGCLASFHCTKTQQIDAGDHTILIGQVHSFSTDAGTPLGYCRGAYVTYQNAAEVEAAVRSGARVGAIIETPQGVVMLKGSDALALPSANKLGTPEANTGLYKLLKDLGLDATLDFVFSVYEDANGPCVIYRGRASSAPAAANQSECVKIVELAQLTRTDPITQSILQRFSRERSQDIYSVYVGDDKNGVVVALQTN